MHRAGQWDEILWERKNRAATESSRDPTFHMRDDVRQDDLHDAAQMAACKKYRPDGSARTHTISRAARVRLTKWRNTPTLWRPVASRIP